MRFEDERYVRLFTRDTTTWLMLRWQGQCVMAMLLRKVDRIGVFDLSGEKAEEAVAALTGMPLEVVEPGLARMLKHGVIERGEDCLIFPKFLEAQEACMSPNARQAESRLRRRDMTRAGLDPSQRETVIYFVQSEHGGPVKIGRADDLAKRLVTLQTARPDKLVVIAAAPGSVQQERDIHQRFAAAREKGEWFSPTPQLLALARDVASRGTAALDVTDRDPSRRVTGHETRAVTPCLASRTMPTLPTLSVPIPVTRPRDFGDDPEPEEAGGSDFSAELASQTRMRAEPAAVPASPPLAADGPGSVAPFTSSTVELALGEAYAEAAAAAQNATSFVLDGGGRRIVRDTVNAVCPAGLPLAEAQRRIRSSVRRYVTDRTDSKYENGWHPRKWQTWLNGGHGATLAKPPAKTVEELDAEYYAAEAAKLAKWASEAPPPDPDLLAAILAPSRRLASGDTTPLPDDYWRKTLGVRAWVQ